MARNDDRIADLERQMAELRAEVAALRDGLADQIRTRRIVVSEDVCSDWSRAMEPQVVIYPTGLSASCDDAGTMVSLGADWEQAAVAVYSGPDFRDHRQVELIASHFLDQPRRAWVEVDGVELAVPAPAS
jgi:hypothetical protein